MLNFELEIMEYDTKKLMDKLDKYDDMEDEVDFLIGQNRRIWVV